MPFLIPCRGRQQFPLQYWQPSMKLYCITPQNTVLNTYRLLPTLYVLQAIQNWLIHFWASLVIPSKACDRIKTLANCLADHDYEVCLISMPHTKYCLAHSATPDQSSLMWWASTGAPVTVAVRMPLLNNIQNSQSTMQSWNKQRNKSCLNKLYTYY